MLAMQLTGVILRAMIISLAMVSIAPAMETVNVATPSHGLIELPVVIALRNRYFSSERLQVQKIQIEPGISVKALLAGEVDYNLAWEGSVRAAAGGLPVKSSPLWRRNLFLCSWLVPRFAPARNYAAKPWASIRLRALRIICRGWR